MSEFRNESPKSSMQLNVLPNSGKVEQLRAEAIAEPMVPGEQSFTTNASPGQQAILDKVIEMIRTVYDPEIPVNIFELGLIYAINIGDDNAVHVQMTLTAPGCPVAGTLPLEVERRVETVDEVKSARVEIVWEPTWTKARMSEAALLELGLL